MQVYNSATMVARHYAVENCARVQSWADVKALLRSYLDAFTDPTRANLLLELQAADELTATQLARRLGLSVNNVYHHIRVLHRLGVLAEPRIVPGPTYVEKYHRVLPAITEALHPGWYDEASEELSTEERQVRWAAFCAMVGQMMLRAAERYAAMSPEDWDRTVLGPKNGMISVRLMATEQYRADLARMREMVSRPGPDGQDVGRQVMIVAGLPELMRIGPGGGLADLDVEVPVTRGRGQSAGRRPAGRQARD